MRREFLLAVSIVFVSFPTVGIEVARSSWLGPSTIAVLLLFVEDLYLAKGIAFLQFMLMVLVASRAILFGEIYDGLAVIFLFVSLYTVVLASVHKKLVVKWLTFTARINFMLLLFYYVLNKDFEIVSLLSSAQVDHNKVFGSYRPQLFFPEPSYLGMYFGFLLFILEGRINKLLCLLGVLFTFSLAGYLLMVFGFLRKFRFTTLIIIALSSIGIFYFNQDLVPYRLTKLVYAVATGDISSSEGSRVNSILIIREFLKTQDGLNYLFGIRWSETATWVMSRYPNAPAFSSVARGDVDNIIVAVLLKTGVLGFINILFIYTVSAFSLIHKFRRVIIFLICCFLTGMIMYSFVWLLIFLFISNNEQNILHKTPK